MSQLARVSGVRTSQLVPLLLLLQVFFFASSLSLSPLLRCCHCRCQSTVKQSLSSLLPLGVMEATLSCSGRKRVM